MKSGLSEVEKQYFVFAGKFAIYMQALRFLTDYLNDDIYYNIRYKGQNLVRSKNQIELLRNIDAKRRNNERNTESLKYQCRLWNVAGFPFLQLYHIQSK